jgi:hypothetical protein
MKIPHSKTALLIAAALTFHVSTTWAATCAVPSLAYPTIQSAVDDPVCTTINVAPGVYAENVTINRSLTLNGAQASQPVALRTAGGALESTLQGANPTGSVPVILINAANVVVDGFTIKNSVTANAAIGIDIKAISDNSIIRYNIFDGITTLEAGPSGTAQAIVLESGLLNPEIGQNLIQNVAATQAAHGILITDGDTINPTSPVFIHDNTITGILSTLGGAYGLLINTTMPTSGVNFALNDLSNLEGATLVHAISVESDTPHLSVHNNNFTNLIGPATDNVAVWFANTQSLFGVSQTVTNNNFNLTIVSYGIGLEPGLTPATDPFTALCNWWGSPDGPGPVGPGSGARVSPNVSYSPWWTTPGPNAVCAGNNVPTTEAQCKNGGWTRTVRPNGTPFKNQGDCVSFVNMGQ